MAFRLRFTEDNRRKPCGTIAERCWLEWVSEQASCTFFDPSGGGRRRAHVRDWVVHAGHRVSDAAGATSRDVANRTAGVAARIRSSRQREPVDDHVLTERVRAQLGRVVSHPRAIDVSVSDGVVTLRGQILQSEVERSAMRLLA